MDEFIPNISRYSANCDIPMGTPVWVNDIERIGMFILCYPYTDSFCRHKNEAPFLIGIDDGENRSIGWFSSCWTINEPITAEEITDKINNYCIRHIGCEDCKYRFNRFDNCKSKLLLDMFNVSRRG